MITRITGTYVSYYHYCKRRLWLFANNLRMEDFSETVKEGKIIEENSFSSRTNKFTEVELEGIKVDFYDAKNNVLHETKRSDSYDLCDEAQLKFYIRVFERNGIKGVTGILEYPTMRHTNKIALNADDRKNIEYWENEIIKIINLTKCPEQINENKKCKRCSYYEFCYC
ncbi:MAG: CRISPR-associated protein Cas4 [Saprospiraceae bacterium]|nr:CRISPR-associated protein Cas4 [Saprospiraceae bacterium]